VRDVWLGQQHRCEFLRGRQRPSGFEPVMKRLVAIDAIKGTLDARQTDDEFERIQRAGRRQRPSQHAISIRKDCKATCPVAQVEQKRQNR